MKRRRDAGKWGNGDMEIWRFKEKRGQNEINVLLIKIKISV